MTRRQFEQLVAKALRRIPQRFRDEMENVAVVVEDHPSDELLAEMDIDPPLPERDWAHGNALPDQITIYQQPILDDSDDDETIVRTIGETVIHEFGHYFGLEEAEIEEIERRYWRGEGSPDKE